MHRDCCHFLMNQVLISRIWTVVQSFCSSSQIKTETGRLETDFHLNQSMVWLQLFFFCEQLRLIMREGRMVKMGTTANKWICTFSFGNRSHFAYSCLQILAGLWSHVYFVCVHACTFKTSILQFSTNFLEVLKKHLWYFVTILFFPNPSTFFREARPISIIMPLLFALPLHCCFRHQSKSPEWNTGFTRAHKQSLMVQ